jgi:DNA-binding transcriptional ArsR family regulator
MDLAPRVDRKAAWKAPGSEWKSLILSKMVMPLWIDSHLEAWAARPGNGRLGVGTAFALPGTQVGGRGPQASADSANRGWGRKINRHGAVRRINAMEPMNPIPRMQNVEDADGGTRAHQRRRARELNKFFKALSDETRRSILVLLERRERTVGEIVRNFELSQPTISRHLSVLKDADLVVDQRRGQHVIYSLNSESMSQSARGFFGGFRRAKIGRS